MGLDGVSLGGLGDVQESMRGSLLASHAPRSESAVSRSDVCGRLSAASSVGGVERPAYTTYIGHHSRPKQLQVTTDAQGSRGMYRKLRPHG